MGRDSYANKEKVKVISLEVVFSGPNRRLFLNRHKTQLVFAFFPGQPKIFRIFPFRDYAEKIITIFDKYQQFLTCELYAVYNNFCGEEGHWPDKKPLKRWLWKIPGHSPGNFSLTIGKYDCSFELRKLTSVPKWRNW